MAIVVRGDTTFGPKIPGILSNIVFYVDAAIPDSYSGSSTTWYDLVGTNHGTLTGNTTISNSGKSTALSFAGTPDQVRFNTFILRNDSWTVYFWFKTSNNDGGLFSHWSGGPVGNAFMTIGGKLTYRYYNTDWRTNTSTGTTVSTGIWVHAAYSRGVSATSEMRMYVNGVLDYAFTPTGTWAQYQMGVIGSNWGNYFFIGKISMCSIYNAEHTLTEVQKHYNATKIRYL